jgi:TetR/AcrR family transcriptional regulator
MPVASSIRKRDPEGTRASILDAAESLFVNKGFAATSMSDIARRAAVTKSLIHHHFGSKEELWSEVKKQRVSQYADMQTQVVGSEGDGATLLAKSIETYFSFVRDNPQWVRLNLWMSLEDPRLSEVVRPDLVRLGTEVLQREQRAGRIRDDVEPRHIVAMFVSLCLHWFMAQENYRKAKLADPDPEKADDAYREDMLKILLEGVLPR